MSGSRLREHCSPLASLLHLHGRVNLVVSCVLFVERGDQEVVEDRCDSGQGKVRGCVLRFGGAQSLERGFCGIERILDCAATLQESRGKTRGEWIAGTHLSLEELE